MSGARRLLGASVALATALALLPAAAGATPPDATLADGTPSDAAPSGPAATDGPAATSTRVLVTVDDPDDLDEVRAAAGDLGDVEQVAPRVLTVTVEAGGLDAADVDAPDAKAAVAEVVASFDVAVEDNHLLRAAREPDDPYFDRQWALRNTGQPIPHTAGIEGEVGIDVDALGAWKHTRGARGVTIALVDTHVEEHPDLEANLLNGRSFSSSSACIDSFAAHGTEVAGVAGAVADNGIGVAGMAPRSRLLPVSFLDGCGFGELDGAIAAITWAADNGADVIVASFASDTPPPENEVAALRAAIEDAGIPVIAAAGNVGRDLSASGAEPVYPASFNLRNQLAVAAINNQGELSAFSNYGRRHVELAAPGQTIYTTSVSLAGNHNYTYGSGTSYAAPYVAGAVALALSLDPVLTSEAILDLVEHTARPLDDLDGRVSSGGMLDAGALITELAEGGACPTTRVPSSGFRDVPASSGHALAVDCIAWWGITRGRTADEYQPRSPVTRGQMATFLATVVDAGTGLPEDPPSAFPDVAGSVHEDAVNALARLGIVRGFGDGTYRPSQPVTRAQMASFLVNTYEHLVGEAPAPSSRWFRDTRGSVHEAAAESLWELGITAGTSTRVYDPHPDVRRDQMGSFVARLLDRLIRDEVIAPR
jgi:subtilisin family serine protease